MTFTIERYEFSLFSLFVLNSLGFDSEKEALHGELWHAVHAHRALHCPHSRDHKGDAYHMAAITIKTIESEEELGKAKGDDVLHISAKTRTFCSHKRTLHVNCAPLNQLMATNGERCCNAGHTASTRQVSYG